MKTAYATALLLLAVLIALPLLPAPPAAAHGGQFRAPGGAVPPGLRPPRDATPPPPPPPSEGPPVTPGPTPVSGGSPSSSPVTAPPRSTPALTGGRSRPTPGGPGFLEWTHWYHNNKDDIEDLKRAIYGLGPTGNPIFQAGGHGELARTSATRLTQEAVRERVLPALLWALDPEHTRDPDAESAAYIALAKVTVEPSHVALLMRGLDPARDRPAIVREAAALALGLLRRAHPADRFDARTLDRVRRFLFEVVEDKEQPSRTRGFAALAVGLLGDQPTGSADPDEAAAAAEATTRRLFDLLGGTYPASDVPVGLLMAIGLQPPASVDEAGREVLVQAALKDRFFGGRAGVAVQTYAALALGRIGTRHEIRPLETVLLARRGRDHHVRRSAAIGLGLLSRHVAGEDRADIAQGLLRAVDRSRDVGTRNFSLVSLAYVLLDDLRDGETAVLEGTRADEVLLETASGGRILQRGFAALALGLVVREIGPDTSQEAWQAFGEAALRTLRAGATGSGLDPRGQAAFCLALGIARDARSRPALLEILVERGGDKERRGYAALALGLIGEPTPAIVRALADALRERSSEELRRQTATALGLLGNPPIPGGRGDAVDLLLEELDTAASQALRGQIVAALGRVGDHRALERLARILRDDAEQDLTRALACAGLGLAGDLEWIPSLARLSKNVNYLAATDLVREVLTIL